MDLKVGNLVQVPKIRGWLSEKVDQGRVKAISPPYLKVELIHTTISGRAKRQTMSFKISDIKKLCEG